MDQLLQPEAFIQTTPTASARPLPEFNDPSNPSYPNQKLEGELKDTAATRKIQKAGREKLRRDKLNEQFIELGHVFDPDRPKNDKATILMDTIQLLRDLTSQVNKLKAEYTTLTEESHELTQEKNDLREEKASLRSDIENLSAQYQQRVRSMFPWPAMDPSVVMPSPSYPFPVVMPLPPGSIPMHPLMQPYSFGNQNPCSTFFPYIPSNALVEHQPIPPLVHPGSQPRNSGKQDSKGESRIERSQGSNEVTTDLELKTPGSTAEQGSSLAQRKCKQTLSQGNSAAEPSSSSRCSSSRSVQNSSFNSIPAGRQAKDEQEKKTNKKKQNTESEQDELQMQD